jgi:hypothetical protein
MKAPKFKDFITEGKDSKNFLRLLIITDEPDKAKEFKTADRLQEECKKLGYPYYLFKLSGGYTTNEDGIRKFHNKDSVSYVYNQKTVLVLWYTKHVNRIFSPIYSHVKFTLR